ncbi:MAG: hypothetical protein EBZ28_06440, partial [Alphaproteobacteria bacterium]|nr:hypothetical protein [Alphaproteobacteria bacterium]
GNLDLDANIVGAASLSVSGTSNLGANVTTSGNQTYTGDVTLSVNTTLTTTSNGSVYFGGAIDGAYTLDITAHGTGDTTFVGAVGGTTALGDITIDTNDLTAAAITAGNLDLTNSGTGAVTGIMANASELDTLALIKAGVGTLTLSAVNTFTGDITISAGTVTMTGSLADTVDVVNSGTYDVDTTDTIQSLSGSGTVQIADSVTLTTGDAGSDEISGVISGTGNLTKQGAGILTLSGMNTYTGATNINAGTLKVTGLLSDNSAVTVASGSTYNVDNLDTIGVLNNDGTVDLTDAGLTATSGGGIQTFDGVFVGGNQFTKQGSGRFILTANSSNYTGTIEVTNGTLQISNDNQLGNPNTLDADRLILNGGVLRISSDVTLNSNRGITIGANHGDIYTNNGTTLTYGGVIAGAGNLTKDGAGTLTLTGTNTLTGSTTIYDGTLQLGDNTSTGSINNSSIINNSALVLDFSSDITLSSDISGTGTLFVTARYFDLYDATSSSSLSTSSWTQIAADASVFEILQRIAGGYVHGSYVGTNNVAEAGISVRDYDPLTQTASFRIRFNHDTSGSDHTKQVTVDLRQNGANVEAKIDNDADNFISGGITLTSNYINLGEDDSSVGFNQDMIYATSQNSNGYGLRKINASVKVTLTGDLTFNGDTTIQKNTIEASHNDGSNTIYYKKYVNAILEVGGSGSLTSSAISNNGNLIFSSDTNFIHDAVISGAGAVIHDGSNTTTFSGTNTYTGQTNINA